MAYTFAHIFTFEGQPSHIDFLSSIPESFI